MGRGQGAGGEGRVLERSVAFHAVSTSVHWLARALCLDTPCLSQYRSLGALATVRDRI